eukprot:jgi/Undpi1/1840/HiC_scaffold_12.g05227.m1
MTTYSRVSTRGGAIQEQRNAPGDDDSNGDGVGLLATSDVLVGIWITFFMLDHEINYLKRLFKMLISQNKSTLPARMYMLSWPARFFLRVWRAVWWHSLQNKYGVPRQESDGTFWIIKTCFLIYSFKVSWAYFKHQLDREERAHGDRVIRGGSKKAELEEPLIATSIRV